ncbi:MAG TPA: hydantoinase/oxoprolinase family protein [Candidatus Cybelea sp.]|jgi:N-methylhydantoinase A|nr:hydantoinase/oxoprolinase family protein [Candidatus Cybelea sp.]
MTQPRALRVGIDVGGTFTDLVATESWSGRIATRKVPSTPREPQRAVIEALTSLLAAYDPRPAIEFLAHSTTVATNALLGQLGLELPRVALVTTDGFRDVIEIGRQNRSEVYNLFVERPRPLVARDDRLTVRERIDYHGNVLIPLDDASVANVCEELRERDVAAVAICLLHSYANDAHERRLAHAVASALPRARVTRSSQVDPQYREYERFSTTVVNAALAPIVEAYLERLIQELHAKNVDACLYVMRSDGGLAAAGQVCTKPAAIVESGPASGAIATAALGQRIRAQRLLSFDMGGTTAKAGTIADGVVHVAYDFEAAGTAHSGRAVKGSGYPVRFPFVDLAEVSAGGGAIAWIDDAGALRVGPLSAGADPGPACYGKSDRPTVTDANVVVGRLHQKHLLGGAFPIDASRSRGAVESLAQRRHSRLEETAAGIIALVDDAMAKVLRIVTVERGLDPRDFALVAFGGGGPLHACALADELGIERAIVPPHPGLFSAGGLLGAELHANDVWPILDATHEIDLDLVERFFMESETRAQAELVEQGARAETIAFRREYDARYRGQSFELTIAHDPIAERIAQNFHNAHRRRYGYDVLSEVVEIVNARLTASGRIAHDKKNRCHPEPFDEVYPERSRGAQDKRSRRAVWIDRGYTEVPVFQRNALTQGMSIDGPAIIEEYDSTTYVAPKWTLTVEDDLLILRRAR